MAAVFKFKADGSEYTRGLNKMRDQTKKFSSSVKGVLAGAFAGFSIAGIKNVLDGMVEMKRAAERLGVGVEMFQKLSYAAKQTGVDAERLADAMKDLDVKLQDGIMRGGSFAELIEELGLDMNELAAMAPDERMLAFADAIQTASGSLSRFGADEFGDAMYELLPLLEMGSEGILKLGDDAQTMSAQQAAAAERASKLIDGTISNMISQLGIWLANGLQMFEYFVTGATQAAIEIANVWKPLGKVIFAAMNPATWLTTGKKALQELQDAAAGAGDRIGAAMDAILDKQLEEEKPTEPGGMTDAERARTKAKQDAAKKAAEAAIKEAERVSKLEKEIADEEQRRKEDKMTIEEKIAEAVRKRIELEKEASEIDPFTDEEEKRKKQLEIEKQITKEQSLRDELKDKEDAAKDKAKEDKKKLAETKEEIAAERKAREEMGMSDEELLARSKSELKQKEQELAGLGEDANGDGTIDTADDQFRADKQLDIENLKTEIKGLELAGTDQDTQASVISSQLASIGGGGGVASFGNDPMLNENKKQTTVLEGIKQAIENQNRGEEVLLTPEL